MLRTKASRYIVFLYSSGIRTLIALAAYNSHRLIKMGKVEIDSFCCLIGDI